MKTFSQIKEEVGLVSESRPKLGGNLLSESKFKDVYGLYQKRGSKWELVRVFGSHERLPALLKAFLIQASPQQANQLVQGEEVELNKGMFSVETIPVF